MISSLGAETTVHSHTFRIRVRPRNWLIPLTFSLPPFVCLILLCCFVLMMGYHETPSGFKLVSVAGDEFKLLTLLLLTTEGWDHSRHRVGGTGDPTQGFLKLRQTL